MNEFYFWGRFLWEISLQYHCLFYFFFKYGVDLGHLKRYIDMV